jgi:hypothetical protein
MPKPKPENLKNLLTVLKYLKAAGWDISKSALYRHRDAGLLTPIKGKEFAVRDVEQYANNHLKKVGETHEDDPLPPVTKITPDRISLAKRVAEAKKLAAQARIAEARANVDEGGYVKTSLFERSLAQRAAIFKSDVESFIRSHASEMCHIVEGDDLKIPDLIDFWLEKSAVWIGRYTDARL